MEDFRKIIILFHYFCKKKKKILNLWEGSEYVSCFKHVRVLNIRKFWLIWQGSEHALGCNNGRVLNILDFRVCQVSAYASVAQGSEYTWSTFHKVWTKPFGSKYVRAQNMIVNMFVKRLWIFEGYTGCWICLNKPEYALIITQYAWICLNNAEYDIWKNRVLNMPEFWKSLMQYLA